MSSSLRPTGVYVPLVTPFDEREAVDLGALGRLAEHVLDCGARGVVALATTGEPTSLDDDERAAVVGVCSEVCVRREAVLIVGAGTNDTRTTIQRHEALAEVAGVAASLAVVPYYVRPSETAIVRHFQAVATRSPVPLITYNIPTAPAAGSGPTRCSSWRRPPTSRASTRPSAASMPTRCGCSRSRATTSRCSAGTTRSSSP